MNRDRARNGHSMTTRRQFLVGSAAALALGRSARAEAPVLTEDGLYRQPWYLDSLLDLTDDVEAAAKAGKRLAVVWELRGCPYCKEMHLVNFARADIADYVRSRFEILQLNIRGDRTVTDFDGEQLSEKRLAAKYQVRFTPTVQFFPEAVDQLAKQPADKREVFRIPGYLKPDDFLAVFRFVAERGYEQGSLREFLRRQG
jgi:thioredoxin-related protein